MTDPTRKPRTLRFRFSRALIVSAPLVGSLACGEPAPAVNTVAPEPEVVEERTNVGGRGGEAEPELEEESAPCAVFVALPPRPPPPRPPRPPLVLEPLPWSFLELPIHKL